MALAVTHVIGTIFILDMFRHYVFGKKSFPRRLVIIGGLAGLAPDIDIILSWLVSYVKGTTVSLHGMFTHSLIWVILFLAVGGVLYFLNKKTG
ncbi:MAG: metal-dependent hydrolase, partial [Nanoarchaeota archaeon]